MIRVSSTLEVVKAEPDLALLGCPPGASPEVMDWRVDNIPNLARGFERILAAKRLGVPHLYGRLWIRKGELDYGLASMRVVTDVGLTFLAESFVGAHELTDLTYHGIGSSSVPESPSNTALGSELGASYTITNVRTVGVNTVEGATATTFRSIGNCQVVETVMVAEHGLFTHGTVGEGVLFDRATFTPVPLEPGEAIQMTYDLVLAAGT